MQPPLMKKIMGIHKKFKKYGRCRVFSHMYSPMHVYSCTGVIGNQGYRAHTIDALCGPLRIDHLKLIRGGTVIPICVQNYEARSFTSLQHTMVFLWSMFQRKLHIIYPGEVDIPKGQYLGFIVISKETTVDAVESDFMRFYHVENISL
jgi:hypothetical protein